MAMRRDDVWRRAIRAVTANAGLTIVGDIISDARTDGYRVRCRFIGDRFDEFRVVLVPWSECELSRDPVALIDHVGQCFEKIIDDRNTSDAERKRQEEAARERWSPYPQGTP